MNEQKRLVEGWVTRHLGPGNHPSGTPQTIHSGGRGGGGDKPASDGAPKSERSGALEAARKVRDQVIARLDELERAGNRAEWQRVYQEEYRPAEAAWAKASWEREKERPPDKAAEAEAAELGELEDDADGYMKPDHVRGRSGATTAHDEMKLKPLDLGDADEDRTDVGPMVRKFKNGDPPHHGELYDWEPVGVPRPKGGLDGESVTRVMVDSQGVWVILEDDSGPYHALGKPKALTSAKEGLAYAKKLLKGKPSYKKLRAGGWNVLMTRDDE